jgi:hypothetical protein
MRHPETELAKYRKSTLRRVCQRRWRISFQCLSCRLLPANIFNLRFTRGFSEECYSFSVEFLFYEEGSPLPAKIFEFRRCGKVDKKASSLVTLQDVHPS